MSEESREFAEREELLGLLNAVARNEPGAEDYWSASEMFAELGLDEPGGRPIDVAALFFGLVRPGDVEEQPFVLTNAGRQYLAREGVVTPDVLKFGSGVLDDLYSRQAIIAAGSSMVEYLTDAIALGVGDDAFGSLLPEGAEVVVDVKLQSLLLAALSSLLVRLGMSEPAACLAEEIVAVSLMGEAADVLDSWVGRVITPDARDRAVAELDQIFELFGDSDVLFLFADEAAGDGPARKRLTDKELGVEKWFDVFYGVAATGHLKPRV